MDRIDWKKEIITIPNLLSVFRLLLVPVAMNLYLKATNPMQYYFAGGMLSLACFTDALDGFIARHWNMVSTLGKVLDPLADKVTQLTVTVCLCTKYPVLRVVLLLLTVKELFQLTAGICHLKKGKMLPGALSAGKISTAVLFISLIYLVLFPNVSTEWVQILAALNTGLLTYSFVSYVFAYFGKHPKVQDLRGEY